MCEIFFLCNGIYFKNDAEIGLNNPGSKMITFKGV